MSIKQNEHKNIPMLESLVCWRSRTPLTLEDQAQQCPGCLVRPAYEVVTRHGRIQSHATFHILCGMGKVEWGVEEKEGCVALLRTVWVDGILNSDHEVWIAPKWAQSITSHPIFFVSSLYVPLSIEYELLFSSSHLILFISSLNTHCLINWKFLGLLMKVCFF